MATANEETRLVENDVADEEFGDQGESHTQLAGIISEAILGASDGLTVPFALAAGLSGAFNNSQYVIVAVMSELAAGAIR